MLKCRYKNNRNNSHLENALLYQYWIFFYLGFGIHISLSNMGTRVYFYGSSFPLPSDRLINGCDCRPSKRYRSINQSAVVALNSKTQNDDVTIFDCAQGLMGMKYQFSGRLGDRDEAR